MATGVAGHARLTATRGVVMSGHAMEATLVTVLPLHTSWPVLRTVVVTEQLSNGAV